MQGLILAAGMGKRLKELTSNNTKCMVEVNGVRLIDRVLHQLDKRELTRIVIVTGYKGDQLRAFISSLDINTEIIYVDNPIYDRTNNIYSLALAKDYLLREDTLLLESDLIFEDEVLDCILDDERDSLVLVDKYESWMDGTCFKLREDDTIEAFIPGKKFEFKDAPYYYKTVNIYKFSREFSARYYVPFLEAYRSAIGENEYYEQVLRVITMLDEPAIKAKRLSGQRWYEIDDMQDLDIASSIFAEDDERLSRIQSRYGGYWRYPGLLDFCYLTNPYYPTRDLCDEIKYSFDRLLTQYPSGQRINNLLAAKLFGIRDNHLLVGNGSAELIRYLMEELCLDKEKRFGIVRPTFEEYPNRLSQEICVVFQPGTPDYSYTSSDLISFYTEHEIDVLIIVNPDNPSGNYIAQNDIIELATWCKRREVTLILDESFIDFSDEKDSGCIHEEIISRFPNLFVVKSVSKCYGVPGLRLGVLASSNERMLGRIREALPIWNINSFGEFYLQIAEKYIKDYDESLEILKELRKEMFNELCTIEWLKPYPSQANYFMCEVKDKYVASQLCKHLLIRHNILIKDLTAKTNRQLVRIALRNRADNKKLLDVLRGL